MKNIFKWELSLRNKYVELINFFDIQSFTTYIHGYYNVY